MASGAKCGEKLGNVHTKHRCCLKNVFSLMAKGSPLLGQCIKIVLRTGLHYPDWKCFCSCVDDRILPPPVSEDPDHPGHLECLTK